MSRVIATIVVVEGDDGRVYAETTEPRGVGAYRSGAFATVDGCLHSVAPLVAWIRKDRRQLIAGGHPETP